MKLDREAYIETDQKVMIEKSSRLPGHYFYPPLYPVVFTFAAASAQKEIKKIRESERNGSE